MRSRSIGDRVHDERDCHGGHGTGALQSGVSVVSLGITVTDASEKDMPGLTKEDFAVFEDGRQQEVRYFAAEPTPLDLAILLDTSGSMAQIAARRSALRCSSRVRCVQEIVRRSRK